LNIDPVPQFQYVANVALKTTPPVTFMVPVTGPPEPGETTDEWVDRQKTESRITGSPGGMIHMPAEDEILAVVLMKRPLNTNEETGEDETTVSMPNAHVNGISVQVPLEKGERAPGTPREAMEKIAKTLLRELTGDVRVEVSDFLYWYEKGGRPKPGPLEKKPEEEEEKEATPMPPVSEVTEEDARKAAMAAEWMERHGKRQSMSLDEVLRRLRGE
jgi:hypothetical protein